jgi:ubiquinone/menaquinone biosynthesis C-methylase UbiE
MKRQTATQQTVFNDQEFADRYARKHLKMARKFGREYSEKLKNHGFQKGRILDAGCGFGETLHYLAKNFPETELIGMDLSEPLLEIARSHNSQSDFLNKIEFINADVHNIPYPDEYFDVVLSINMVHLVDDPLKMLQELERVLHKNGYLFIADIRRSWLGYLEKEFKSGLTVEEARKLFSETDLREGNLTSGLLWWRLEISGSS